MIHKREDTKQENEKHSKNTVNTKETPEKHDKKYPTQNLKR